MEPTTNTIAATETSAPMLGVFALIKQSLIFYKNNYKSLVQVGLVFVVINIVGSVIMGFIDPGSRMQSGYLTLLVAISIIVIGLATSVIQFAGQIAFIKTIVDIDSSRSISTKDAYKFGFKIFFPALWLSILIGVISFGMTMLFVLPGLIIGIYISFALVILISEERRGVSAISASYYYVKGNFWKVVGRMLGMALITLILLLVIFCIVIIITFISNPAFFTKEGFTLFSESMKNFSSNHAFVSSLISFIVTGVAYCFYYPFAFYYNFSIYKYLKSTKTVPNPEIDFKKSNSWFTGISILGLIIGILFFVGIIGLSIFQAINIANKKAISRQQSEIQSTGVSDINFTFEDGVMPTKNRNSLETKVYTDSGLGFKINLPLGWVTKESKEKSQGTLIIDPTQKISSLIQVQYFNTKITSDEIAKAVISRVLGADGIKKAIFSKLYLGSKLTYKIVIKDPAHTAELNYYLVTDNDGMFALSLGWNSNDTEKTLSTLIDSISTFQAIK